MRSREHSMTPQQPLVRRVTAQTAIIALAATASAALPIAETDTAAIRPFHVKVADADIADLQRRLVATRWPDKETVADDSQGAPLAQLQELVKYWGTSYDWRKAEAQLNAVPQFTTTIDGVDVHFIHVRSRHSNALPLIITHGWPGSVFEQIKLIGPLTDPTAFGGRAEDAFDVVIPSLPGYGFSSRPADAGWGLERTARAWGVLMTRLGYTRYVAQGGDWGAGVTQSMAQQRLDGLIGIHSNFPATLPPEIDAAFEGRGPMPSDLSDQERATVGGLGSYVQNGGLAYLTMMGARPQAVGYGITDSPAGLAGWMLQHGGFARWTYGKNPQQSPTVDEVLDNFTLYWLTNSAASSARIYWENRGRQLLSATAQKTADIAVPVAVTVFPEEIYQVPETWARRAFHNVSYFHKAERGGHFAAWEYPDTFSAELRAAFRPLRASVN
jgi:pimeloyl-ACP methyl ester carboxylesterase